MSKSTETLKEAASDVDKYIHRHTVTEMRFDWNLDKAASNIEKHDGVTFEEACEVFDDDFAIVEPDRTHSIGEQRFRIIGVSSVRVLFVVYTEREGDVIWIISAREAEDREREKYYEG